MTTEFKHTIAYGILRQCAEISKATGIPSNDLVRTCLNKFEVDGRMMIGTEIEDGVAEKFFGLLEDEIHAITGVYSQALTNKPKKGRYSGLCYINAYNEWKQTGNDPVIGWEATHCGRFVSVVPHAFNRDKEGNYYDTASNYKTKGANARPCWVRCDGDEAKTWLTTFAKFYHSNDIRIMTDLPAWTDVWGGVNVILHSDNKAYISLTKGLTKDFTDKDFTFHKAVDCSVPLPCPDCEYCLSKKTWETTKYIKGNTFMNKDACLDCYNKSNDGFEWGYFGEERKENCPSVSISA
jgi:hypothetical protein